MLDFLYQQQGVCFRFQTPNLGAQQMHFKGLIH